MSPKHFYLALLAFLVVLFLFTYQTSIVTPGDPRVIFPRIHRSYRDSYESTPSTKLTHRYIPRDTNHTGNLPTIYLNEKARKPGGFNKTCARFPDLFTIKFKNDHWQMQNTSKGTFHLFNAYVDQRNGSFVRIVAMYDVYRPNATFFCQLWFDNGDLPKIVESEVPFWLFHVKWGADTAYFHHPYIISCPIFLNKDKLPISVSLVEKPCENATNNLRLFQNNPKGKKDFVVCVKGLSFPFEDRSARLAEWIELVYALGADKINFYEFSVHPNTQRVLSYYADKRLVEVTPIALAGDYSNHPYLQSYFLKKKMTQRRLQEVVTYNDCLYKHLHEFKYVVLLDTDEVIVPLKDTWVELIRESEKTLPNVTSYVARNVYFLDSHQHNHTWFEDIPKYMHVLQHVHRAKDYTKAGYFIKGFHNTTRVFALHNHFPFKCLNGCNSKEIDIHLAHLQHYRADCTGGTGKDCQLMKENSVIDTRVWNFKEEVIAGVERTLRELEIVVDFPN